MSKSKIIIGLITLFFVLSIKAQETLIVRGFLERPSVEPSANFQRNMFCYLSGGFIMPKFNEFSTFRVDSVISGSFQNLNKEINKTPFNIRIILINECVILDYRQNYILQIKQFPNTNYYYIDNLNQVFNNEKHLEKFAEYHEKYQQNIEILTKGTLQERRDFLNYLQQNIYIFQYRDYRYISYIIPYMTNEDSITNYIDFHWSGRNIKTGERTGGVETHEEKGLYSDFLYTYLDRLLPFRLPAKTTDSVGWHQWYDSLFLSEHCFQSIKYVSSQHKIIHNESDYIGFLIPDITNRKLYFRPFVLNMDTDEVEVGRGDPNCNAIIHINADYSIQNHEIPKYNSFNKGIDLYTLTNNVFCRQNNKIIPLNLRYNETGSGYSIYPNLIVHNDKDFFVFSSQNPDGYNCLKAGKINRKGKWIIEPKNLYKKEIESYVRDIDAFSFFQSYKDETVFAFSDRTYGRKTFSAREKYTDAIIIYKLNADLKVKDSAILTMNFPRFDYQFSKTHLLKKDKTYLLVAEAQHNNGYQLYYMLLNENLNPKTDFIQLSNFTHWSLVAKPTLMSDGFLISWADSDLSENVLRSVLIDKSGKQSNIINITNHKIDEIHNVEFDKNNVDIYLFSRDERMLIRKRINKKEYGF